MPEQPGKLCAYEDAGSSGIHTSSSDDSHLHGKRARLVIVAPLFITFLPSPARLEQFPRHVIEDSAPRPQRTNGAWVPCSTNAYSVSEGRMTAIDTRVRVTTPTLTLFEPRT